MHYFYILKTRIALIAAFLLFIHSMEAINLKKFKKKFDLNRKSLRYFLTRTENKPPANLDVLLEKIDKEVWAKTDCLSCANCCKTMSPTFTFQDIKRISAHLDMRPKDFKEKWLYLDKRDNDWMNKSQPCQFLDLKTNMCSIYEVRPADCAGFPHFLKKPTSDYMHIHKQNIEYCPATMMLVEKLKANIEGVTPPDFSTQQMEDPIIHNLKHQEDKNATIQYSKQ